MQEKFQNKGLSEKEFEQLFKTYFKPLVNFANKFLNDIDQSKEIVHDVFVRVWEKRQEMDKDNSVKSYIYRSVNNRCLNYIRDNKKFVNPEITAEKSYSDNIVENLNAIEIQAIIDRTLNSLPERSKKIFIMSRYENLKYAEIAEKLGISIKTVEANISKALKELRKNLKQFLTLVIILLLNF